MQQFPDLGTFYRSDWTKSGNYQFSARLTQKAAPSHPISYGLMIGGSDLAGPNQTYTYFLVRNQGDYYIANKEGDKRPAAVVNWTANPAIASSRTWLGFVPALSTSKRSNATGKRLDRKGGMRPMAPA